MYVYVCMCMYGVEWDSKYSGGVNWRQKIDTQKGAVLATELKNNSCKLAKWTAQVHTYIRTYIHTYTLTHNIYQFITSIFIVFTSIQLYTPLY